MQEMNFERYYATASVYIKQPLTGSHRVFLQQGDKDDPNRRTGYFGRINQEVEIAYRENRPCLVFCDTDAECEWLYGLLEKKCNAFKTASVGGKLILGMTPGERDAVIGQATYKRRVTVCNRVYGRGTDFVCYDSEIKKNGGVHVIQTFFAESLAEEVQLKGEQH
jgi:preprotein translocase subunit SecA